MTEEERSLTEEAKQPVKTAAELQASPQSEPENGVRSAEGAAEEMQEPKTEPSAPAPGKKQKNGFGTAATFWLLVLYDLPGVGLIASALAGFLFAKTRAHRSLARACFVRGLIFLLIAAVLVGCYFFLRGRFALSNFLERILQELLNFVRSNSDKL